MQPTSTDDGGSAHAGDPSIAVEVGPSLVNGDGNGASHSPSIRPVSVAASIGSGPTLMSLLFVQAQHDFRSDVPSALSFNQGDIIEVLTQLESGWWDGLTGDDRRGWFPSNYVRPLEEDEYDGIMASYEEDPDEDEERGVHRNSRMLRKWRDSALGGGLPVVGEDAEEDGPLTNGDQDDGQQLVDASVETLSGDGADARDQGRAAGDGMPDDAQHERHNAATRRENVSNHPGEQSSAWIATNGYHASEAPDYEPGQQEELLDVYDVQGDEYPTQNTQWPDRSSDRPMSGNVEDYWLPSLTPEGEICYVNTKTGERSWEAPGLAEDVAVSDGGTTGQPLVNSTSSAAGSRVPNPTPDPPIPTRGLSVEPIDTLMTVNGFGAMLDSGVEMNSTGFASYARKGGEVPAPWISRMLDDGSGYLYVNQETGESTDDFEQLAPRKTNAEKPTRVAAEAMRALGISLGGVRGTPSLHRANSSSSQVSLNRVGTPRSETIGLGSPRLRTSIHSLARSIPKRLSSVTSSFYGTKTSTWEGETLRMLAAELDVSDQATITIVDHQNAVSRRVNEIVTAADAYITTCASGSEAIMSSEEVEILAEAAAHRLRMSVRSVISPVRSLMHACRLAVLGLPEEVHRSFDENDATGRRRGLSHLSGDAVHGYQRRVIAALSKIVFFCHSAVGMDWPFPGSAERVALDARDLQRSVSAFVGELQRSGCLAGADGDANVARGLKHNTGHLQLSEEGLVDRAGGYTKKRDWKRFTDDTVGRFRTELAGQFQTQGTPGFGEDTYPGRPLALLHGYDGFARWFSYLEDLDVPVGLDLDGPTSSSMSRGTVDDLDRYKATVVEAVVAYKSYIRHFQETQEVQALLLMEISSEAVVGAEQQMLIRLRRSLQELDEDLVELLEISQDQALLISENGIKGRMGRRSTRIAEREKMAKLVRTRSRNSSLNSASPDIPASPASDVHKPLPMPPSEGRGLQKGKGRLIDGSSKESLNKSQISLLSRTQSGPRTPGSRRSSTSGNSWTQQESESVASSVRQSFIGRVPFFRTRSASTIGTSGKNGQHSPVQESKSKMKLQKLLGEEEFESPRVQAGLFPPLPPMMPSYLQADFPENDLIMHADGNVKAGTLPALVDRLTMHQSLDAAFNSTFLMTHRSFATAQGVFDLLRKRYHIQPPSGLSPAELADWQEKKMKPIKLRVFNTFKTWVDQHFIEASDLGVLDQIHDFAATVMAHDSVKLPIMPLIKAVQRRQNDGDAVLRKRVVTTADMPPTPLIPKISIGKALHLLDINPVELARQLTIMESKLYAKIRPIDCLDKAWSVQDAPDQGPNIKAMVLNSNRTAAWVGESILSFSDIKRRSAVFKHWILTADHCRFLHNFSSMMSIMAGLNSGPIFRLSRTKNLLNNKTMGLFEEMDRIMQPQKNFAYYRDMLKLLTPPCIPFLGVYQSDLTFVADGNADEIPCPNDPSRQLIHFFKRVKTAEIIREIQQYQLAPYTLSAIQPIMTYIELNLENSERAPDPWEQSQKMEPREREDEKLARMLRESGMI